MSVRFWRSAGHFGASYKALFMHRIGSKSRAPIQRVHFSRPSPRCPREVLKIDCALLHACVEETLRERDAAVGEVKCTG